MGLVIIGHRSSKSTFDANNKMLRPGSGSRIPRCRPKSLSMSIHTVEFEKVEHLYHLYYLYHNHLIVIILSLHCNPHRGIRNVAHLFIKKIILVHGSVIFVNIVLTGIWQTRSWVQRCGGNRLTQGKHSCNNCYVSGP